jgi:membrane protease YdiL (CAAX protease family)
MMPGVDEPVLTPWKPWEAIPVALAALSASILVAVILAAAGLGPGGPALVLSALALEVAFVGFSVIWVSLRHRHAFAALGFRSTRAARDLAVGAWFGAGLFGVTVFAVAPLLSWLWTSVSGHPPPAIEQPVVPQDPTTAQAVLGAVAVVIGAPLGEEVFFRGFLHASLRGRMGFAAAAAISSVAFALFHVSPFLILLMVFVGFALAWLFERRGSLIATIGAHAMFNVIGYTLLLIEPGG